ncbi:helix-turn-helix transcriptional regulator [Geosporobacter ferrireducens]|uniref:DNA-binding protein n=1 Tax=Geosporobacter ferrireducens TaxID=1424294 RepID=A0A1D8GFD4_9FIRM|nr:DNA-binding protein [Geosporobacter ferrireducens]MTI54677.1 helix-turn-helix transcriptional regulator [Geosporobacter ferrireducens]
MRNKVKEFREKANMTQEQLAKKLGVSRQTIISIEADRYNPSLILAFKIASAFDRLIEDVFDFSEVKGEIEHE